MIFIEYLELKILLIGKNNGNKYSERMYKNIKGEIGNIDSEYGGVNSGKLWKLRKTNYGHPTMIHPQL